MSNYTDHELKVDELARATYAAALVVEGFSEASADRMSARQCPEEYYEIAEGMLTGFGLGEGAST